MQCQICGHEGVKTRRTNRSYGQGKDLLIIENIPVVRCPKCGESYVTAETLREIERLKRRRRTTVRKRPVAVVDFA